MSKIICNNIKNFEKMLKNINDAHDNGATQRQIAKQFNISLKTVNKLFKNEYVTTLRSKIAERENKLLLIVEKHIINGETQERVAKYFGVSAPTINSVLDEAISLWNATHEQKVVRKRTISTLAYMLGDANTKLKDSIPNNIVEHERSKVARRFIKNAMANNAIVKNHTITIRKFTIAEQDKIANDYTTMTYAELCQKYNASRTTIAKIVRAYIARHPEKRQVMKQQFIRTNNVMLRAMTYSSNADISSTAQTILAVHNTFSYMNNQRNLIPHVVEDKVANILVVDETNEIKAVTA